jgi:hypothetical protein
MQLFRNFALVAVSAAISAGAGAQVSQAPVTTAANRAEAAPADKTTATSRPAAQPANASFEQAVDRIGESELRFIHNLDKYAPLAETYIQRMQPDADFGTRPGSDDYFLGKMEFRGFGHSDASMLPKQRKKSDYLGILKYPTEFFHLDFLPMGFAQMIFPDDGGLNRKNYDFTFVRREFLGDVRCLVIDVAPKQGAGSGRFIGRIWAEDQGYNIVRFSGTYNGGMKMIRPTVYLHFDSWRLNMAAGEWLPAYIYVEESDLKYNLGVNHARLKAQTRLWGYGQRLANPNSEFSEIVIDDEQVKDKSEAAHDLGPVEAQRQWERQAEENVLDRLTKSGLLAQPGEVEKVLGTVINNLEATNNLDIQPDVRARVLVTTPMESFTVGHTIVLSRGMIDVLPDEATLAAVIAHELAHIALGHKFDTAYAFPDRMIFNDEKTYSKLNFHQNSEDEEAADKKAIELLRNSPYKDKLPSVGLFLKALETRQSALPHLLKAHLGNTMMVNGNVRLGELASGAPELKARDVNQVPALPLGARLRLDPYSGRLELNKNATVPLLSPKEKLSFELTPVFPHLTRVGQTESATAGAMGNK